MLVEETCEGNFLWMQKHQNFAGTSFHEFIKKLQTRDSFFPEGFFINFVFFTSRVFRNIFKLFVLNAAFLYPLKTSEDLKVFWCFQGLEKGCIGKEWVNVFGKIYKHLKRTVLLHCTLLHEIVHHTNTTLYLRGYAEPEIFYIRKKNHSQKSFFFQQSRTFLCFHCITVRS